MAELTTYDEIPYDSRPRYATHPDCLATLGILRGMTPAPVAKCRVLELGCASGGNLLDLAESYPESAFLGIDLSTRQIQTGQKVAAALGLKNLTLLAKSFTDLTPEEGPFDYILAHGLYSWVNAELRDQLLQVCRNLLSSQGIAYVSYNTLPGWHLRAPIREMMTFHTRRGQSPKNRIARSRELLDFLVEHTQDQDTTYGRILREELEVVRPEGDFYVYHEHLSPENHACYFHEFIAHAQTHHLRYLGEAQPHMGLPGLKAEVRESLQQLLTGSEAEADVLELEQYVDFLINRTFRRTLLVRDEVELQPTLKPENVAGLSVSSLARPCSPQPDITSESPEEFINDDGVRTETAHPLAKAMLMALYEHWPQAIPFGRLCQLTVQGLGLSPTSLTGPVYLMLSRSLIHLYGFGLVGLHAGLPRFVTTVSERPTTTPLIRLQAHHNTRVCNRRHRQVELSVFDRAVLSRLDGSRDREKLLDALTETVLGGDLSLTYEDQPVNEESAVRSLLQQEIPTSLERLAGMAVLIA